MKNILKKNGKNLIVIIFLIMIAIACRATTKFNNELNRTIEIFLNMTRSMIYIGLYIAWGFSIQHRVVAKQVRIQLTAVAVLLGFWMFIRTIKYYFVVTPWIIRALWYMYYIPMLFVPLLAIFISMSLGKKEDYRMPKWMHIFTVITAVLVLMVLTNDLHCLVFTFPEGEKVHTDVGHGYALFIYVIIGWEILCTLIAVIRMLRKCRIPNTKKILWLPFFPIVTAIVYGCVYLTGVEWLRNFAGDITAFQCLTFAACFETFIQCGLIQTNSYNKDVLTASDFPIIITDKDYRVYLSALDLEIPEKTMMEQTEKAPVIREDGMRLSGNAIRGGYVLWTEDLTEILEIIKKLQDLNESLKESHLTKQEEYRTEKKKAQLIEANRLYNQMQLETAEQVKKMRSLLQEIRTIEDREQEQKCMMQLMLLGSYFKRRNNLLFIAETQDRIKAAELDYCIKESFGVLELMGVSSKYYIQINKELTHFDIIMLYDAIEQVLEKTLGNLQIIIVMIRNQADIYRLTLNLKLKKAEALDFGDTFETEREEEDEYVLVCDILSRSLEVPERG